MTVCVTGATGFVGGHLARELVTRGERVRVTYRDEARLERLRGLDVEPVRADVLDRDALRRALGGVDTLFHAAGVVGSGRRAWQVNAVAPRIAVEAAADAGVRRVVHTSSVVAIGPAEDGRPGREDDVYRGGGLGLVYVDSKHEGEVEAIRAALRRGMDLVMANPAYVIGVPLDRAQLGETSSRQVLRLSRGEWPALVDGPTNVVDVRDVAAGHVLVAEQGRTGERYVLGGHNSRWAELAETLMGLTGRAAPALVIPRSAARLAHVQNLLGLPPVATGGIVTRLAAPNWQYVSEKAERELGYAPRPLEETLAWIAAWARELEERGTLDGAPGRRDGALRGGLFALLRAVERAGGPRLVVASGAAERGSGRRLVVAPSGGIARARARPRPAGPRGSR